MNAREPVHDTLARLDGGVQELLDDVAGMRRVQSINLLVTASVGGMTALAACFAVVLLVGGGQTPEVAIEPLAAEVRALHGKLHTLAQAQTQVAGTGIVAQTAATPDGGDAAGADEAAVDVAPAEHGSPDETATTSPDTDPGAATGTSRPTPAEGLVRVTLVPTGGKPQPFLVWAEEEAAALAVVDGLQPEDEVVAVETLAPELRASLQRRLGIRALLARDRPAAEGVPTS
ncbi:MAG TPA: hypothetical protein VFG43_15585 [Geminicoccaceae bacterium]|nr:hypothetical protein [Geminicoccaceae bacterium]